MTLDAAHWQDRIDALADKHGVVGATLAVAQGTEQVAVATGVLNRRTGQPATPDSLFQAGSITKVWTTTLAMQLVDEGLLDLDKRVVDYLPGFRVASESITRTVTVRQLMNHTSGIDGDLFLDTGRGDDAVERYVEAMAQLTEVIPPGKTMSYCNSGYTLLGHLVATLRGGTYEQVLAERLLQPLGLDSAGMLPEEALLHGAATGHLQPPGAEEPVVTPQWGIYRSAGPAGLLHCTAAHLVAFARLHTSGGLAPDGTRLLSEESAAAMLVPHIEIPDPWLLGTHWGLGWILGAWGDHAVHGHDGTTLGQNATLRVLPGSDVVIALMTNGGRAVSEFTRALLTEIGEALVGAGPLPLPEPDDSVVLDPARYVGTYSREGVSMVVAETEDGLQLTVTSSSPLSGEQEPSVCVLRPHTERVLLATLPSVDLLVPAVFFEIDGQRFVHMGARTTPQTG